MVLVKRKLRSGGATGKAESRAAELQKEITRAEESDSEEEEEDVEEENKDSEEQDSSEEDSEEEEEQDDEEEEDGSDEEEDNEQDKRAAANSLEISPMTSANGEQCTFDLRNLLGMNVHQISTAELYSTKTKKATSENLSIAPTTLGVTVNEDYILEKATDGCAQLVAALWQLPVERSDAGPMVFLPSYDEIKIPRALPPPPPKKDTKWEKFAREKGIPLNREKRSQKVFDEVSGEWKFRHGYQKANEQKEWPIMEVNPNDDPNADPWEKEREAKRTRVNKNTESRMRNEERAGNMKKGTTTHFLKSREKTREAGKAGGGANIPTGVPVDLRSARGGDETLSAAQRGKTSITAALKATQRSTASLGKFDKIREGEPEKKKAVTTVKKRKLETSTDKRVIATEGERGMKVLKSVIDGGGVAKEKARKKGELAKGETAYDYDYDDGLGASSFKKKKGRAGAGKMKKMTKKRVK